jgi:hypothetical protein
MSYQDYMDGYNRKTVKHQPSDDYQLGVQHQMDGVPSMSKHSFGVHEKQHPSADSGAQREKLSVLPYDLVPFQEITDAYVRVAEHGAKKYEPWNWSKGLSRVQLCCSLLRHTFAYIRGQDYDNGPKGSGLLHTDHILWNAAALSHNVHHNLEDGRRPEPPREYKGDDS